ncbi:MAG: DUF4157 domain-containing protein [Deltaproteobacteria bacterium]|nr:DUF4157 domain-containing protein [Deltaproteobacteria bacterium]
MSDPEQPTGDPATETEVRAEDLSDDLARKYDPDRLLRMVSRRAGRGESLEHSVRAKYEKRFGVDLSHVRVYSGEFAEEFNRQRDAYAVTIGSTGMILMGGSPDKSMGSASGQALLAHELTHVAQAQRGLHRKGTFDGAMDFTHEDEEQAEEVEAEELSGGGTSTRAAANAASEGMKAEDGLKQAIEQVRERVLQMAGDSIRTHLWRNGNARRA